MKKLLLASLVFFSSFVVAHAQDNNRKLELFNTIIDILDKREKVWTENGRYNYVTKHSVDSDNGTLTVSYMTAPVSSGGDEYGDGVFYFRCTIDLSKVGYVKMGKTNYGYSAIAIMTKGQDIKQSFIGRGSSETYKYVQQVSIPSDNSELLAAIAELATLYNGGYRVR